MACTTAASALPQLRSLTPGRLQPSMDRNMCSSASYAFKPVQFAKGTFVVPMRLLATTNENLSYVKETGLQENQKDFATFTIMLRTSKKKQSGLSDPYANILVSMMGENGNCVLQSISATEQEPQSSNKLCFDMGAVDIYKFIGPDIGPLAALWVAPDAGTWRLEEAKVEILTSTQDHVDVCTRQETITYIFEINDYLLGDGGDLDAVELKPRAICKFPDMVPSLLVDLVNLERDTTKARLDGMVEYEALKSYLLFCDTSLVIMGTLTIAAVESMDAAIYFALGGVGGFLYLLRLQGVVDQLPSSIHPGNEKENFKGFWSAAPFPVIFVAAAVVAKLVIGDVFTSVSSYQVLVGLSGFLTSKVALLLAAAM